MNLTLAKRTLDMFLERVTSTIQFRRIEPLRFIRDMKDVSAELSFPCRIDLRGFAAFNCIIGVRHERIAQWLDDDITGRIATISATIHALRSDTKFNEWKFTSPDDIGALWDEVLNDLKYVALPFMEKYSNLSAVQELVSAPGPSPKWVIMGPERRCRVQAAIRFVEGDKLGAIEILDRGLRERKSDRPKDRFEMEMLRERFVHETVYRPPVAQ
jgi:hypothetical protein